MYSVNHREETNRSQGSKPEAEAGVGSWGADNEPLPPAKRFGGVPKILKSGAT